MPQFKNLLEKKLYYRKKEKEMKKAKKKLDKEVEEEYKRLYPKDHSDISNKLAKKMVEFFDILWPDDEEQMEKEYESLLTKEEKAKEEEDKKEEKKTLITAIITIIIFVTIFSSVGFTYLYLNRSHYEKVISPMIKTYFKDHYNQEIKLDSKDYICYEEENEEKRTVEKCTNLLITTTNTNKHVLTIDDNYSGDDVNYNSFIKSYVGDFNNRFSSMDIIYNDAHLSYKDFYHDFYQYEDYINILPVNKNYEELVNTNKLTVTGKVIYQGYEDINSLLNFLSSYSEDSRIYLIKIQSGLPNKLTILSKNGVIFQADFRGDLKLDDNITFYELDRSINSTSYAKIIDVTKHGIQESYSNKRYNVKSIEYEFKNGRFFEIEYERKRYNEPEKPHYYLLKFNNNSFIQNHILFDGSRGRYTEMDKEDYPLFIYMTLGSETYLISNDSFGMAIKTEKKEGFLCNLGLC